MSQTTKLDLDSFTLAYIEAMLWTSTTEDDTPMDSEYSIDDLAPETMTRIVKDCQEFQGQNRELLINENAVYRSIYSPEQKAGHDFWLTRNGHGCGFWDGDWSEPAGKQLTEASKRFGELDLHVGDDGKLYF